ncbi:MAG: sialate O-acetylesterase [Pirellulales bacterium]|nr:sialate O-acetylesterase [Pirellulales bacterium]
MCHFSRYFMTIICLISLLCVPASLRADVTLPNIFADHMVFQRDQPIRVFGHASPGESITVTFAGESGSTEAADDGHWRVQLPAVAADRSARTLTVEGNNTVSFDDILVGDVWLCSGQSNMEWTLTNTARGNKEITAANYPEMRLFNVTGHTQTRLPQKNTTGTWQRCTPKSVRGFSAVAYFFGRTLYRESNVPVGLIGTNWGGTRIEPWIPKEGFEGIEELRSYRSGLDRLDLKTPQGKSNHQDYLRRVESWLGEAQTKIDQGNHPGSPPSPPSFRTVDGATTIYNSMVHGIAPFSVRGAIWYQGESNGEEGDSYYHKMRALIAGWRKAFENPNLLFYFVQLANWQEPNEDPAGGDGWAAVRDAQRKALSIPHTGMAVTTDIGEAGDIHPRNKQDVGDRLAQWGLRDVHQRDVVPSGPLFKSAKQEGNSIRITFDHVGDGLMAATKDGLNPPREDRDGKLRRFAIAGDDQKWVWADAVIDESTVVVSSPEVKHPVAVRYAYSMNPEGANLYNRAGLPASPFRTDAW